MHILQGDYSELFRTLRRKQRLSEERKADCQDVEMGSAHETKAMEDCNNFWAVFFLNEALYLAHT